MGNETIPAPKTDRTEQFPVASRFLEAGVRAQIIAFYRFARTADDIADDPALSQIEKLSRLELLEEVLTGKAEPNDETHCAFILRESLAARNASPIHALDLLKAFRMDALEVSFFRWGHLMGYCRLSAAPVGRFLLDLHGETSPKAQQAADSLCAALQVTNHLQDARKDFLSLGRAYFPMCWLSEMGINKEVLGGDKTVGQVRLLFDRALDGVDFLVREAETLPKHLTNRRLALQAGMSIACAKRLASKLRQNDPLASQVKLGRLDFFSCGISGVWRGLLG